jgi:solute carrier family 25 uncoupling protein 8/9
MYRGYLPALARQGPVMVVQMPLVEQLRVLVGLDYL